MSLPTALLPVAFIAGFAALLLAVEQISIAESASQPKPINVVALAQ